MDGGQDLRGLRDEDQDLWGLEEEEGQPCCQGTWGAEDELCGRISPGRHSMGRGIYVTCVYFVSWHQK